MAFETFCCENKIDVKLGEVMKNHTSFKIGGKADYFVSVRNTEQLKAVITKAQELEIPYFILGKGSNLLVSDKGIDGAVIDLLNLNEIIVEGDCITAGAGASLAQVCTKACEQSLTGLEFAYGIPGTVGGGLYMNAGAYGGELSQVVESALCMDSNGNTETLEVSQMQLGYRTSVFKQNGKIITSVTFKLKKGEKEKIKSEMEEIISRRKQKQPLEYASAGSTFKRPEGHFAGALIEKNNLKGVSVGGAQVSEKHAGFVINRGGATCEDVKCLMKKITDTVLEQDGVKLETEVIFVGRL